ncbi:DUF2147 domain-containing protein [Azohydromonas caseinilytica]|uniref:DUF2147 domain-containing protein n=1 Tax=Azohydromonas caseinilytica TaxID=2728836 RepID=A0A848FKX0_9BURK|nr:DUF2147 domain-containing protein [Azohydromonas caseinilytica]NML18883.1 DUF2147 domain-containing protein [Azohydromonas caseinilytica]
MRKAFVTAALLACASAAWAQGTPVGLWRTIDDATGQAKSLVRITESGGVLTGRVEQLLDPAQAERRCSACSDERKDQPVQGMTILRNVRQEEPGQWGGGDILDPNNGKVYKVRLRPEADGSRLVVRGYIGLPALGRSQTWQRVE